MNNIRQQIRSGQCGIYNLANIMRDENIIDNYANDEDYLPCGNHEANLILHHEGYCIRIETIAMGINWSMEIPASFAIRQMIYLAEECERNAPGCVVPFILQVQTCSDEFGLHAISVICMRDAWAMSDPRDKTFIRIKSPNDIYDHYKYINGISVLQDKSNGKILSLRKEWFDDISILE